MKLMRRVEIIVLVLVLLSACSPETSKCDVICKIQDSEVDCECPDICYNSTSDIYIPLNVYDDIINLDETIVVDEGMATIRAATSAISAAHVNVFSPDSVLVGSFIAYPNNYESVDSVPFVLDSGFVFPVEVSYLKAVSWWNAAYLAELSLCRINEKY